MESYELPRIGSYTWLPHERIDLGRKGKWKLQGRWAVVKPLEAGATGLGLGLGLG